MLMESFVGVMAMIAACTLDPGVYFAMNPPPAGLAQASQVLSQAGFVVTPDVMHQLATQMGEQTLIARSGGAPSLAVGMAQIFAGVTSALGGRTLVALWYHFAIMFEALFILTTIDTGTRVGRFMLQEIVGHARAARLARGRDDDRGVAEGVLARSAARLPRPRRLARGLAQPRCRAPDLQRSPEHLCGAVVHDGGRGADRHVAAGVVAGAVAPQARPGARGAVRGECICDRGLRAVEGGQGRSKAGKGGCAWSGAA